VKDDGKPQDDMAQRDEQAYEMIEQLNLLESVDHRVTPEHVAKRFYELLDDIDAGDLAGAASDRRPRDAGGQMGCGGQITSPRQEVAAEHASLNSSLVAAIADAQSKAKAAADELRCAEEATTAARQHAQRVLSEAQAQADEALQQAAKMIRDARDQARRIRGEAEDEAEQITSAAADSADEALQRAAKMIRDARDQARRIGGEAEDEAERLASSAADEMADNHPAMRPPSAALPASGQQASVTADPVAGVNARLRDIGPERLAAVALAEVPATSDVARESIDTETVRDAAIVSDWLSMDEVSAICTIRAHIESSHAHDVTRLDGFLLAMASSHIDPEVRARLVKFYAMFKIVEMLRYERFRGFPD
jgi:cell division septum initiation protein DivIVA